MAALANLGPASVFNALVAKFRSDHAILSQTFQYEVHRVLNPALPPFVPHAPFIPLGVEAAPKGPPPATPIPGMRLASHWRLLPPSGPDRLPCIPLALAAAKGPPPATPMPGMKMAALVDLGPASAFLHDLVAKFQSDEAMLLEKFQYDRHQLINQAVAAAPPKGPPPATPMLGMRPTGPDRPPCIPLADAVAPKGPPPATLMPGMGLTRPHHQHHRRSPTQWVRSRSRSRSCELSCEGKL